jgi:hypothetical protein
MKPGHKILSSPQLHFTLDWQDLFTEQLARTGLLAQGRTGR